MKTHWTGMLNALALAAISLIGPHPQRGSDVAPILLAQAPDMTPAQDIGMGRDGTIAPPGTGTADGVTGDPGVATEGTLGTTRGHDIGRAGSATGTKPSTGFDTGAGSGGSMLGGNAATGGATGGAPVGATGGAVRR